VTMWAQKLFRQLAVKQLAQAQGVKTSSNLPALALTRIQGECCKAHACSFRREPQPAPYISCQDGLSSQRYVPGMEAVHVDSCPRRGGCCCMASLLPRSFKDTGGGSVCYRTERGHG